MFLCPAIISLPPQPPAQVEIWPSDPPLPHLEFCGYNPDGIPIKCECTDEEREREKGQQLD